MRRSAGLTQKKSLGQVFLRQSWPVDRMVERLAELNVQSVLEIGPGGGILTRALLKKGFAVTAVERDDRFVEVLRDLEREFYGAFTVVPESILNFNLSEWVESVEGNVAVVGNIPYNISSPILIWALPEIRRLTVVMLMTQLEFAQRVVAAPGSRHYGSLSVYAQLRASVRMLFKVGRTSFKPVPKVDSAVIELCQRHAQYTEIDLVQAEKVTRRAFMQRRKTLRNTMSQWLVGVDASECPIDLGRRPETLTPEEFISLGDFVIKQQKTPS